MSNRIEPLTPGEKEAIRDAVRLHHELLPQSPVSQLGRLFMERFYYGKLVEDGLVKCNLYYEGHSPVGFVAFTTFPSTFLALGLRRHWLYLAFLVPWLIVRQPGRLRVICQVFKATRARGRLRDHIPRGEILSMGVLPPYRTSEYARRTGHRVSLELFESAREYFAEQGIPSFRMLVERDNREAQLFYIALGCHVVRRAEDTGKTL